MNFSKSFCMIFVLILSPIFIASDEPRIDLEQAFKQDRIYEKHAELLTRLGCAHHLQQAGAMSKDEETEFPWDDYERLMQNEKYRLLKDEGVLFTSLVTAKELSAFCEANEIEPWNVRYGECYPFPWGHYHALKEERLKELKKMKEDTGSFCYQCLYGTAEEQWRSKVLFDVITDQEFLLPNDPEQFKQDCLSQLESERTKARWKPIKKSLTKSVITLFVAGITASFGDRKSEATKTIEQMGIASGLYQTTQGVLEHVPSLIWPPENPLKNLEERFAQNKCFIPPALWPKIIKSFTYARDDTMNRQKHINFLNFALDLTVYKPKPELQLSGNRSIKDVKTELYARIDDFFKGYPKDRQVASTIKLNVAKFIDSLTSQSAPAPCYLYLHGPGGIGKTHFVQTLAKWIDELIPQAVSFENFIINSSVDLEGNSEQPGAFVKVLRNQLAQGKRGSVVFIDEACCLNNASMCSAIKRTFNGNRSQLSVSCFGSGLDGAVKIDAKVPMLIILAGNASNIDDQALATRIKNFFFPSPDRSALVKKALQVARQSNYLQEQNYEINEAIISQWVNGLPSQDCNFRYVENNVEDHIAELMEKDEKQ